jgi:acyl-CoA reductase-like NAD-dependent aldehyde dehydrogenase
LDLSQLEQVRSSTPEQVSEAVARARKAQPGWEALGFEERAKRLLLAAKRMLERRAEAVALIQLEAGKPEAHALMHVMHEALGPLEFVKGWIKVARPYLRSRQLPVPKLAFPGKSARVDLVARGVVGIIAPWNYPLGTYFKPVFPALLSGNSVVIKPSEYAPRTGAWFHKLLSEFLPPDVLGCVQGGPNTGKQLIQAGIDALTFTGSVASGKAVLKLAAEEMIPCSVELGGKDPAIVLPDCNLPRTVAGILNWSFHNAGQDCGAIERVYVLEEIADRFVLALTEATRRLEMNPPRGEMPAVGPVSNPKQVSIIEEHLKDAVGQGAKILCGGKRTGVGLGFFPTVVDHCRNSMKIVSDETFGPVVALVRVKTVDEAIALANDSRYGLNASLWTEDLGRAEELAKRLQAGTVFINNHAITGSMPFAPWTGVKDSGYGVANSQYALATFTRPKTFFVDKNRKPDPWWLPADSILTDIGERLARAQLGDVLAAVKVPILFKKRVKRILDLTSPKES